MSNKAIAWVFQCSKTKNSDRLMLLAIADSINDDTGTAWPSVQSLASKVNVKERQAQNLIQALEAQGELHVDRAVGRRNTSTYRIIDTTGLNIVTGEKVQHVAPIKLKEKVQCSAEKVQSSTEKVQCSVIKGAIAIAPDPSIPIEPNGTQKGDAASAHSGYFGMPVYQRKEKREADGFIQQAAKLGVDASTFVAMVDLLIDAAKWRSLVDDLGHDDKLTWAKEGAIQLIKLGNTTPEHISLLIAAYRTANTWRGNVAPLPRQLTDYAGQLKDGLPAQNGRTNGNSNGPSKVEKSLANAAALRDKLERGGTL